MNSHSLKRNYFYNALFTTTGLLLPLLTFTYVAPIFKPLVFGKLSFAQSTVNYFVILASAGMPLYGAREIARRRGNRDTQSKLFWELMIINAGATIVTTLVFAAAVLWVPKLRVNYRLLAIYGQILIFNLFNVDWFFVGEEQYKNLAIRSIWSKSLLFGATILLIKTQANYETFAFLGAFAVGVGNFAGYASARRKIALPSAPLRPLQHMKPILVLLGSALTASVYVHLDTVMLGFLAPGTSVGLYAAAARISRIAVMVIISVGATTMPRMAAYLSKDLATDHRELSKKAYDFISFLSIPITVFIVVFAPAIIVPLTQGTFDAAANTLRISALIIVVIGLSNFVSMQILFPAGKEHAMLVSTAIAALVNILLNSILIPRFQHNGAAFASVCAELAALSILFFFSRGMPRPKLINKNILVYIAAAVFAAILAHLIGKQLACDWLGLGIKMLAFSSAFVAISFASGEPNTRLISTTVKGKLSSLRNHAP